MKSFKVTFISSVVVEAVDLDQAAQIVSDLAFDIAEASMPVVTDIEEFEEEAQGEPEPEYEPEDVA